MDATMDLAHNPFDDQLSIEHSNYARFDGRHLECVTGREEGRALTTFVHDSFRALTLNDHFTCAGAKAAVRGGDYRFGLYGDLATRPACAGLARDLFTFLEERPSFQGPFSTFVASFSGPATSDEAQFEDLLWQTLQQLHELDAPHHAWDPHVVSDPADPRFSFSFAGTALFIVGLHAASSRAARKFAWPTLVFNPHDQFEHLKEAGRYQRFQGAIRHAEATLQGEINPMLSAFGERSEASQYSGRQVGPEWRCPFHFRDQSAQPSGDD
jgi:FPC/CPF motif-containing protein YcgG